MIPQHTNKQTKTKKQTNKHGATNLKEIVLSNESEEVEKIITFY